MKKLILIIAIVALCCTPANAILAKYWRLRVQSGSAMETLSFAETATVAVRCMPWKFTSGALVYGTVITDDFGFDSTDTIVAGGEVESTVVDNSSNLYLGIKGYFEVKCDLVTTGTMYLWLEESDDNTNWPSDTGNEFDVDEDLKFLCAMSISSDAVDEKRGINFEF